MTDAMKVQVGGSHYKGMAIEPFEFGHANQYDPELFSVMKYVSRHRAKNGVEDLEKAKHIIDIRVVQTERWGPCRAATNAITASDFIKANGIKEPDAAALRQIHFMALFGTSESIRDDSRTLHDMIDRIIATYEKES